MRWLTSFQRWVTGSAFKVYVVLVLFATIPLLAFLYSADRFLRSSTERRLNQQGGEVADLVVNLFAQQFGEGKDLLRSVAVRSSLVAAWKRGDMEEVTRHLQQTHELSSGFRFVSVFDTAGTMRAIYPDDPAILHKNFAYRDWYKGVTRNWSPYVSSLYQTAAASHEFVVAVAVPIRDENGKPIGILMAPYTTDTIRHWNRYLPKSSSRFIEVVDQQGTAVVGARSSDVQPAAQRPAFEPIGRVLAGQSGNGVFQDAADRVLAIYRPIPLIGWGVIIAIPESEVGSAIWQFERPLLGLAMLFIVLGVTLGSITAALSRELRRQEEELRGKNRELDLRNREVERANHMKSHFLASMSHELRTPLNAILGFSELLTDGAVGPLNEKQARWVEHIRKGGKHLLQLINDILDLAKIEAGQVELVLESFEVTSAVPEVVSNIRPLAMAKRIRLVLDCAPHLRIRADRLRFKQVLYNLLSNAIKFTGEGGEVRIEAAPNGEFATFVVADTGIGMRPEDLDVIFEEFRQVGDESDLKEGTGLGLAITKRLIEQQGGTIKAESQVKMGTRMIFTLPTAEAPVEEAPAHVPTASADQNKPLILIVDDDPAACELLAHYLHPEGYATTSVHSGRDAVELASRLGPAAITLDILMSSESGWETLYELRNHPATRLIPIIVVSVVDQKKLGLTLGATDYLVKPVERNVLLRTIAKHVQPDSATGLNCVAADDEPEALRLMSEVLLQANCIVRLASNGRETLAQLRNGPTDLLLLDLMMPEMDGFEVIRQIEADPALRDIPIIVLTAKSLTKAEAEQLSRRTEDLLQKDGNWRTRLLHQLKHLTERSNPDSEEGLV